MAGYMHGNLAVNDNYKQREVRKTKKVLVRKPMIPASEKLLYLLTIIICVIVAGAVIFRFAQIYEVNTRIQHVENEVARLEVENRNLQLSIRKLQEPSRLSEIGKSLGLVPSEEKEITQVTTGPNPFKSKNKGIAVLD